MRPRLTIRGWMSVILFLGLLLGLVGMTVRQQAALRAEQMSRALAEVERARYEAERAAASARASKAATPAPDGLEQLRRENAALRERVRDLEASRPAVKP